MLPANKTRPSSKVNDSDLSLVIAFRIRAPIEAKNPTTIACAFFGDYMFINRVYKTRVLKCEDFYLSESEIS